jgi:PKD repeat protein
LVPSGLKNLKGLIIYRQPFAKIVSLYKHIILFEQLNHKTMNNMKKIFFMLLLISVSAASAIAQQTYVTLTGHVMNQQTGSPVSGQTMYISADSINYPGYYNQVITDANGFYTDNIPYIAGTLPGMIVVSTSDCNGTMVSSTAAFYPGVQFVTLDFSICGNPVSGCVASFSYQPASNDNLTFNFFDSSYTMPGSVINSWLWNFGDGTASSEQNPLHTFAAPGLFNVCLTIRSNDSLCSSIYCMPVEAGSIYPGPCENSFWYYKDSTAAVYIFEGSVMNGSAYLWLWDFGDGTTATGQSVTHSFAGPDTSYTVCLTTTGLGPDSTTCTAVSCQDIFAYIPSPCESSFWYYADSSATGYTFEGWDLSNQVNSWIWDFGDGSTASGQVVSHFFAAPNNTYTVCLTTSGVSPDGSTCTYTSCQDVYTYVAPPCESYFWSYPDSLNNAYVFEGWANNNQINTWSWDFGDGTTATGQLVSHNFTGMNTLYTVCLTTTGVGADGEPCSFVSCQNVYIYYPSPCQNNFEAYSNDGSTYTFEGYLISGGYAIDYSWDFGDGSTANGQQATHTFVNGGTIYNICLTTLTYDPATNDTCSYTSCQAMYPGGGGSPCQASFFAFPVDSVATSLTYMFINTSAPGYLSQQWTFGDGTPSSDVNPVHLYAAPGIYNACLTVWDSAGTCQSNYCMDIIAGEVIGNYNVGGVVLAGNTLADQGIVWLIGANNSFYAETLIDSAGTYYFGGVPAGSYYIYAMLTPGSPNFFGYMPTYYENSLSWQGATIVNSAEPNAWYPINLVPSFFWSNGPASITGTINWGGSFKSGGNPAANVEIVLFNNTGAPIAYTFSDNDGNFAFNNLPYGEYRLHAEMTGKTTEAVVINLSENTSSANINLIVSETAISALGIGNVQLPGLVAGNPYPNPVGEILYLDLNNPANVIAMTEVIDLQGRIIFSKSINLPSGKNQITIPTGNLSKGMYLLRIKIEGHEPVQRRFIR